MTDTPTTGNVLAYDHRIIAHKQGHTRPQTQVYCDQGAALRFVHLVRTDPTWTIVSIDRRPVGEWETWKP